MENDAPTTGEFQLSSTEESFQENVGLFSSSDDNDHVPMDSGREATESQAEMSGAAYTYTAGDSDSNSNSNSNTNSTDSSWRNTKSIVYDESTGGFATPQINAERLASVLNDFDIHPYNSDGNCNGLLSDDLDDLYPTWIESGDNVLPVTIEEIASVFLNMGLLFGFQNDNVRNMFDHLMSLLDSRASRMPPVIALLTLHADFIGGDNANYKKWYLSARMDIHDSLPENAVDSRGCLTAAANRKIDAAGGDTRLFDFSPKAADERWRSKMTALTHRERISQLVLYLLIWGEANQVRYMPECIAFIFKCLYDHYVSLKSEILEVSEGDFLDSIITPIYKYARDQVYEKIDGVYYRKEKDHRNTVGYDDMNQLFWYCEGLLRLRIADGTRLLDKPPHERYLHLKDVQWSQAFYKTYRESRSWLHLLVNFNRIWIIHVSIFWFYTSVNVPTLYTVDYSYTKNSQPFYHVKWSIAAIGGAIPPIINMVGCIAELFFVPRAWPGGRRFLPHFLFHLLLFLVCSGCPVYVLIAYSWTANNHVANIISTIQMVIAVSCVLFFSIVPTGNIFSWVSPFKDRRHLASKYFTAGFASLARNDRLISYCLWLCVFAAKLTESYFFLTLSLRDPARELTVMNLDRCADVAYLGSLFCRQQARFILLLIIITDLILFFLDTYLWYIIFNTLFSVTRSFYLGVSIWTPWKHIYSRLPDRIHSKIICQTATPVNTQMLVFMVAEIWNAIIAAMYKEHLLPPEQMKKLIFSTQIAQTKNGRKVTMVTPTFFVSQEDQSFQNGIFEAQSEAQRRISFFAQSLATPIPEPLSVLSMPSFTVLIPHYGEKIILSLREIIKEDGGYSKICLLDYLKQLYPLEWDCFVKDSKGIASREAPILEDNNKFEPNTDELKDLPYYCVGFKHSKPEYTLRTRIWASARNQTLFRTISGFMNYNQAIRLLHSVERTISGDQQDKDFSIEEESRKVMSRKFRMIVAVQRLTQFTEEEKQSKELILREFPDIKMVYLEKCESPVQGEEPTYYSCMIDGSSDILPNGERRPRYRIKLSGNPILGDGKSDNQNHSLIFYRGEYIQLVDANQDNYLEECLKIRSVLSEFEEIKPPLNIYGSGDGLASTSPVAILGAREYIFSENIGILGDIAAGKEQTFGTLFARTLAKIGGKLHYGHPDFLNGIFMTTRGGVSKAQKGLHLNEDIYAGMNALLRGGRIKHCEYMQCGKGRDLGFGSILNFTTKIGAGMGEQMLSREYFYLGTRLPIDRFLSFYYAHPGFHINNMLIIVSLQFFLVVLMNIAGVYHGAVQCVYDKNALITDPHSPVGCQNLVPIVKWIERCVISIFVVFFISFLPLFVQELTERGFLASVTRLGKHFASLSPFFEVFVCQIYAQSLIHDLTMGGAKYISTGRGFATTRVPFTILYRRFGTSSIYFGLKFLMVLVFVTSVIWKAFLIWFWITTVALCISPILYNPHQFSAADFFLDYREFLNWMFRGDRTFTENSWVSFVRANRGRVTGFKRKIRHGEKRQDQFLRPHFANIAVSEIFLPLLLAFSALMPYIYLNSQSPSDVNGKKGQVLPSNPLIRLALVSCGPMALNCLFQLTGGIMSCLLFPVCIKLLGRSLIPMIAGIIHFLGILSHLIFYYVIWICERWDFSMVLSCLVASLFVQSFLFKLLTVALFSRENNHDRSNQAWWSGKWINAQLGWAILSQPFREYWCKVIEMSLFTMDFLIGHFLFFIQTPALLIPYIDRWHSMQLFWMTPSQLRSPVFTAKQRRLRRSMLRRYTTLYFVMFIITVGVLIAPAFLPKWLQVLLSDLSDSFYPGIVQPLAASKTKK